MEHNNKKTFINWALLFIAFMLLQPVWSLLFQLPQSLYVFTALGDMWKFYDLNEYGRPIAGLVNTVVVVMLYLPKFRKPALILAMFLTIMALIGHAMVGIQLPTFGEAVTSMYGMIQTGDHWQAVDEARRNGFSRNMVLLSPSGYELYVPKGYDNGLSAILYLVALILAASVLNALRGTVQSQPPTQEEQTQ